MTDVLSDLLVDRANLHQAINTRLMELSKHALLCAKKGHEFSRANAVLVTEIATYEARREQLDALLERLGVDKP